MCAYEINIRLFERNWIQCLTVHHILDILADITSNSSACMRMEEKTRHILPLILPKRSSPSKDQVCCNRRTLLLRFHIQRIITKFSIVNNNNNATAAHTHTHAHTHIFSCNSSDAIPSPIYTIHVRRTVCHLPHPPSI